ncbi:MAG TPA: replication-associated recombination protein A [Longimicrobiales bacterium]|nr:replication-associated recombination protein A [Longimicrobiales bacterium]
MTDTDLFGETPPVTRPARKGGGRKAGASRPATGFEAASSEAPLAARMRPRSIDEFVGQEHLLGPGKPLRTLIESDDVGSMILWGPPGTGKTTLAAVIANRTDSAFVRFSAVTEGVPRVREIIAEAEARIAANGKRTILFCDEIHRFNRAQQDAFLPHVEAGTVTLIGATTENPSFEVNGALLSRARVFVLQPLGEDAVREILNRALVDEERGLGGSGVSAEDDALTLIAREADGDARRALNALETAVALIGADGTISEAVARDALQRRMARYDKSGEEHFNLISALHKSVRGSDPDGALYWLARMMDGGEDRLYLARRIVRMAVEDIGLADPQALAVTIAARDAYHFLGSPEGDLALAQAVVYLAAAPKSNRVYAAMGAAMDAARETPAEGVPLHIRNAPTKLMGELGYGRDYAYAFDSEDHYVPQEYLPDRLRGRRFYEPSDFGFEKRIAERLAWWRAQAAGGSTDEGEEKR